MSFQIMHALGLPVSSRLVNHGHGICKEAADIVQFSLDKSVRVVYPKDFWCKNVDTSKEIEIFASHDIPDGKFSFSPTQMNIYHFCLKL